MWNGFVGHVLKLVTGAAVAQAITLVTAPILSRLFPPEAFGTCSVFAAIIGLLGVIVCLRYDYAIMLPERDEDAINLLGNSLSISLVFSGVVGFIIWNWQEYVTRLLKSPELGPYLGIVPGALFIQGLFQSLNSWNSRRKYFGRLSVARITASITTSATPMVMSAAGQANAGGLIWSWVAGTAVFTLTLGVQIGRGLYQGLRKFLHIDQMLFGLKRYWKFPVINVWGELMNNLSWFLPTLMLSAFFSQTIVGYYALASRVILLPSILVGNAIARVFLQKISVSRNNQETISQTVQAVFQALVLCGLLPSLILTLAGQELFSIVFGPNWTEAGRYSQILGPWLFFLFVASPLSALYIALERQDLALIVHLSIFFTRLFALIVGGLLNNIDLTLWLWTATGVLTYGAMAFWTLNLARVPYSFPYQILLRYSQYSLPTILIVFLSKLLFPGTFWLVLIACGVSIIIYSIIVFIRERKLFRYLLTFSKRSTNESKAMEKLIKQKG